MLFASASIRAVISAVSMVIVVAMFRVDNGHRLYSGLRNLFGAVPFVLLLLDSARRGCAGLIGTTGIVLRE
eukprot:11003998-Lingulodinium_polyedra.AAC.1